MPWSSRTVVATIVVTYDLAPEQHYPSDMSRREQVQLDLDADPASFFADCASVDVADVS